MRLGRVKNKHHRQRVSDDDAYFRFFSVFFKIIYRFAEGQGCLRQSSALFPGMFRMRNENFSLLLLQFGHELFVVDNESFVAALPDDPAGIFGGNRKGEFAAGNFRQDGGGGDSIVQGGGS